MMFLVAAYGRHYQTENEVLDDWTAGKDFQIVNGPYCSIRDLDAMMQDFSKIFVIYGDEGELLRLC